MRPILRFPVLSVVMLLALPTAGHGDSPFVAEQISAERFDALSVGGPDAAAGVGDWALQNGTICAAFSDPTRESALSSAGGVLVDLARCGANNDQWGSTQPLLNADRSQAITVEEIRTQVNSGSASLTTVSNPPGLSIETHYRVDQEDPTALSVRTTIRKTGDGGSFSAWADIVMHATGQLRPFSLLRTDLERSSGFAHPASNPSNLLSMVDAFVSADAIVLVGSENLFPRVAYGVVIDRAELLTENGEPTPVPVFASSGGDVSIFGFAARPYFLGSGDPPGLFSFAQIPFMRLGTEQTLVIERRIIVGDEADVASITDSLFEGGTRVSGTAHPATRVHVLTALGAPVTEVRPDDVTGEFSFVVPSGDYQLTTRGEGFEATQGVEASGETVEVGRLAGPAFATVDLPSSDPMRLVFIGEGETLDPAFGDDHLGLAVGDRTLRVGTRTNGVSIAGVPGDPTSVDLRPGRYRVLATRGIEYSIGTAQLDLAAGDRVALEIAAPARATATPGWIGADLHVHSAESFDSAFPLEDQVRAFAAMGGEVLVMTEHDRVFDPRPAIERLGLAARIASVVGVEVTSAFQGGDAPFTIGHLNALPVPYDRMAFRGGATNAEGRHLRDVLDSLRALPTAPWVQLNHPRDTFTGGPSDGSYFTHLARRGEAYDPALPLDAEPNAALIEAPTALGTRDVDYDGVELLNGPSMDRYRLTRADWFSLLRQGVIHTGTANSDTHSAGRLPAIPRNLVQLEDDDPGRFDPAAFTRALDAGNVVGTSGPILSVMLGGTAPGQRFSGPAGSLVVSVDAPDWIPVSELRVFVNGEPVVVQAVSAPSETTLPLTFEADAFVTVEVEGAASEAYAAIAPGYTPLAFSNPIFVDQDADGEWTPPGMAGELPRTLTAPLEAP